MPTLAVSDATFRRLQAFGRPLVDSAEDVVRRVLDLAEMKWNDLAESESNRRDLAGLIDRLDALRLGSAPAPSGQSAVVTFRDDEEAYERWRREHPDDAVFNHFGGIPADLNVLHKRAHCPYLSRPSDAGKRTTVRKVCGRLEDVAREATALRGGTEKRRGEKEKGGWVRCSVCSQL